jgi:hypothetical protein
MLIGPRWHASLCRCISLHPKSKQGDSDVQVLEVRSVCSRQCAAERLWRSASPVDSKPSAPSAPAAAPAPATPAAPAPVTEAKKEDAPAAPKEEKKADAEPKKEEPKPAPALGDAKEIQWGRTTKFTMVVPNGWKQEEAGGMRQLQVSVPKVGNDAENGEMVGFIMPGGGGADANIQRWIGQMGGPDSLKNKKNVKTAKGADAIIAELEGTYSAMSPRDGSAMAPKTGYKMLGAYIGTDAGEVYLKLSGPKETIEAQKAAFDKMVESFK